MVPKTSRSRSTAVATDDLVGSRGSSITIDIASAGNNLNRRKVAVFRKDVLPISETFIYSQLASYQRWSGILIGYQEVAGLATGDFETNILFDNKKGVERARLKLNQYGSLLGLKNRRLVRILKKMKPDLIHAHFGYDAILAAPAARLLDIPMVITLHGTDIVRNWSAWRSGDMGFFFRFYPAKIQSLFRDPRNHFVAVSSALRERALEQGAPSDRTGVVYTGIETASFRGLGGPRTDPPMILFVGRLVSFKGCDVLIRAVGMARQLGHACRLVVAGNGPLRSELETLASSLQVNALFMGAVDMTTVKRLLGEASLFCLPSVTEQDGSFEGFGMVLLEAQAAGVPVLTSAKAGLEAVIPDKTGYLFKERDVDGLAGFIINLLERPKKRADLSVAAQQHVREKFDIQVCTTRLESLYDQVISNHSRRNL